MEHHLLPQHPTSADSAEIRVPCLCGPPYYDGEIGAFLTYPLSQGKPWLVCENPDPQYMAQIGSYEIRNPQQTAELEVFYQKWLFFGFLKEVLRQDFNADAFVFEQGGAKFIQTNNLMPILEEVFNRHPTSRLPYESALAAYKHFSDCSFVIFMVLKTCQRATRPAPPFNWKIVLSIASLAETVITFFHHIIVQRYGESLVKLIPKGIVDFPNDDVRGVMMRHGGWCPSELHTFAFKYHNFQTLVALSRMDRRFLGRNHGRCTKKRCEWYQINPKGYTPKHRDAGCSCELYRRDSLDRKVRGILFRGNGSLPMLDISGDGEEFHVDVVEAKLDKEEKFDKEYVAISHVWADGLGNPNGNALPRCQLSHLRGLVDKLKEKAERVQKGRKIYVWIDTLCCPCVPQDADEATANEASAAKRIAINYLRATYRKAKYVLVLDAALQALSLDQIHAWEALLWIFISGWTSRLWCLQEGILPESLWFQFQDQPKASSVLKHNLLQEMNLDSRVRGIYSDLSAELDWLEQARLSTTASRTVSGETAGAFITVTNALQNRAVSYASDEALCVATLLDLPLQRVQQVPEQVEDRMSKVWELIDVKYTGIPVGLLTMGYLKLERPGFRWAPRTFLEKKVSNWLEHMAIRGRGRILENPHYTQAGGDESQPRYLGLSIKSTGYVVRRRTFDDGLSHNPWESLGARNKELACASFRDTASGDFYAFNCTGDVAGLMAGQCEPGSGYNYFDSGPCAILTLGELKAGNCIALLGKFEELEDGRHKVTDTVPISFRCQPPGYNLLFSTAESIALSARSTPFARRMDLLQQSGDKAASREMFPQLKDELIAFLLAEAGRRLEDQEVMAAVRDKVGFLNPVLRLGVAAKDWFFNDYVGDRRAEQEWIID